MYFVQLVVHQVTEVMVPQDMLKYEEMWLERMMRLTVLRNIQRCANVKI